ncbi:MAG: CotH kinase family protein [Bacteroidales bacterium]|nr:CotH kinase family protein [Bacteroidales bacterium]
MRNIFLLILIASSTNISGQLRINEFLASNTFTNEDPDYHESGDWIELYNKGKTAVNLMGYYITDNFANPGKWKITTDTLIPAGGFVVIWADGKGSGLHTNFKLSKSGEVIALYSPEGILLDSLGFSLQATDISKGSVPDGSTVRYYFIEPTPGLANTSRLYEDILYSVPDFSVTGGLYTTPLSVGMSSRFGGIIRYTLDGSEPCEGDLIYNIPVTIDSTTIIRARLFKSGMIPGPVVTHTYFISEHFFSGDLPVISIASDPENFWDSEKGIYVQDFKPEWEVPVNIELFENNGSDRAAFNERAGVKINGLHAWQLPQKMLGIYFRGKYGNGSLDYPLFFDRERKSYNTFALRASGSDWSYTLFRDAMIQNSTTINMKLENQGFRPCVLYINGQYMGIHNMREKVDEDYVGQTFNLEDGTFDMVENENYAETGDVAEYNELAALYAKDLNIQENFNAVAEKMDITNFTDFICTHIASRNTSINHNMMAWKPKGTGKWRWILVDLDRGYFNPSSTLISYYTSQTVIPFRELMQNEGYKAYFGKRLADHLYTTFSPIRINRLIDHHQQLISDEMPYHIGRWLGTTSSYGNAMPSLQYWYDEVEKLKVFAGARTEVLLNNLDNYGFDGHAQLSLAVSPVNAGGLVFNGLKISEPFWDGAYLKNIEIELVAKELPGYRFKGWVKTTGEDTTGIISTDITFRFVLAGDAGYKAVYEPDGSCVIPSVIDKDYMLNKDCSPYFAQGDITIKPGKTLTIGPGVEIILPPGANIMVHGNIVARGTAKERILFRSNPAYGDESWGAICFLNTPDTSHFAFVTIEDASKGPLPVRDGAAISAFRANLVLDHLIIENTDDNPIVARYSDITLTNSSLHSKVTGDLINVKYGKAMIGNCLFRGNEQFDTDAIDYDDVEDGVIRNCKIYNFFGFNSDGIDIGEKARNIMIDSLLICDVSDKGISVGQQSTVRVSHCTFVNCNLGLGLKDSCKVTVDHCTFYSNNYAVSCFEKNPGSAGGNLLVKHSILSNSYERSFFADNRSSVEIVNSLSDTDSLPEENLNIFGNPLFYNPNAFDFRLSEDSPCKNQSEDYDETGTRFHGFTSKPHLMFTRIFYNPLNLASASEYLAIMNPSDEVTDISGYKITRGIVYEFPANSVLYPGEQVILVKNLYGSDWLNYKGKILQWTEGSLSNEGEAIQLMDRYGIVLDQVEYRPALPWPPASFNLGEVLVLKSTGLDNHFPENWATEVYTGTDEVSHRQPDKRMDVFPNPAKGMISVHSGSKSAAAIEIIDLSGRVVLKQKTSSGNITEIDLSSLKSGSYLIRCGELTTKVAIIR